MRRHLADSRIQGLRGLMLLYELQLGSTLAPTRAFVRFFFRCNLSI